MRQEWTGPDGEPARRGHILFVAPSAYPLGGVATWLGYIVQGLKEQGWEVTLGLTSGRHHNVDAYIARHPMAGIERISCGSATLEARIRSLLRVFRKLRPDIVVSVNIPDVYPAVRRLRQAQACKLRVVMALHALEEDYFHDIKGYADTLDALIAPNRLALTLAEKHCGLERNRGFYAPCGVPIARQDRSSGGNGGVLRIAFAGRLAFDQKRVEDIPLIAAGLVQRGAPCEWLIAGAGPQEDWLRRELSACAGNGMVNVLGNLGADELSAKVYQQADVLLITSSWETGPIVAWEAMAHGVTVVSSSYVGAGMEDSLHHLENCLLFPAGDTGRAVDCLLMLRDSELRQRLAEAGFALVAERYSREASIEAWSRSFAGILKRPPRPPLPCSAPPGPSGRLDRLLGVQLGENIRELLGRQQSNAGAGDEWPHSHSTPLADNAGFLAKAARLDRPLTE